MFKPEEPDELAGMVRLARAWPRFFFVSSTSFTTGAVEVSEDRGTAGAGVLGFDMHMVSP